VRKGKKIKILLVSRGEKNTARGRTQKGLGAWILASPARNPEVVPSPSIAKGSFTCLFYNLVGKNGQRDAIRKIRDKIVLAHT